MKMFAKLVMLLVVLAFCLPADGEILIFNKTMRGFFAEGELSDPNDIESPLDWDAGEETLSGYLILEVEYDANGLIVDIGDAVQVEYWMEGIHGYYAQFWHYFEVERIEVETLYYGDVVYWVLTDSFNEGFEMVYLMMVRGGNPWMLPTDIYNWEELREIVFVLNGSALWFHLDWDGYSLVEAEKEIYDVSLYLNFWWTWMANGEFDTTKYDDPWDWAENGIVKYWLSEVLGYEEEEVVIPNGI